MSTPGDEQTLTFPGMWHLLYQIALALGAIVAAPILLLRRRRHYAVSLPVRLGLRQAARPPVPVRIWIHAVSVGEVGVAATLKRRLPSTEPFLVTTVTPTGQERAHHEFRGSVVTYLPFDFSYAVNAFFDRFEPRLLVLCEGDYWPTVLRQAEQRDVPVVVINGRISDRSFRRLASVRRLLEPLFGPVSRFGMQTDLDRERLVALGVPADKITVTGNLKFDSPEPVLTPDLEALFRRVAGPRPLLVAGSTMRSEEEVVLDAFEKLQLEHEAVLVLAPRHPERWETVAELLRRSGRSWSRRSEMRPEGAVAPTDIVLLDTLGELAGLYRLARAAFIGGTIVPTGGHNPLEAARFGVPVAVGPSMENFLEIATVFDKAAAWQRVGDEEELASTWSEWISRPEQARDLGRRGADLVARHRGAVERTLEMLGPWLPPSGEGS